MRQLITAIAVIVFTTPFAHAGETAKQSHVRPAQKGYSVSGSTDGVRARTSKGLQRPAAKKLGNFEVQDLVVRGKSNRTARSQQKIQRPGPLKLGNHEIQRARGKGFSHEVISPRSGAAKRPATKGWNHGVLKLKLGDKRGSGVVINHEEQVAGR
ncbi:MAG: hypothetical protein QNJ98_11285 [Planctomycetota bacterium]|nr:hypothetical protein [Planctomycetota bacterium]